MRILRNETPHERQTAQELFTAKIAKNVEP